MAVSAILATSFMLAQAVAPATECIPSNPTPAMAQLCLADAAVTRAAKAPAGSVERTREYETAADLYRRASDLGTTELQVRALSALAQVYDADRLNDPGRREGVLRELIALVPGDPDLAFQLAALQESQGFLEASEDTLLTTRQAHSTNVEIYRRLAQFYARRVTSLNAAVRDQPAAMSGAPLQRDPDGVYRLGSALPPPRRMGVAIYPEDARAAGIKGAVQTEIVIDETGRVVDAKVLRSVPLLDEAAVNAVREWQFQPATFNGKPIPIRMTVTVQFAP